MTDMTDDILDSSIDDLADLPEFALLPSGSHKVVVEFARKEINSSPYVVMSMKLVETLELANPASDKEVEVGTECDSLFKLDNEFGQGNLKKILKPLAAATGQSNMRAVMEAANGMEVIVVVQTKPDKKGDVRMNVKNLIVE